MKLCLDVPNAEGWEWEGGGRVGKGRALEPRYEFSVQPLLQDIWKWSNESVNVFENLF